MRLGPGQAADARVAEELLGEPQPAAAADHDRGSRRTGRLVAQTSVADVDRAVGDAGGGRVVADEDDGGPSSRASSPISA